MFLPAYTSTSLSLSTAKGFSYSMSPNTIEVDDKHNRIIDPHHVNTNDDNKFDSIQHIIHFHIPVGHHGFYVKPHSLHDGEDEFLLPRRLSVHVNPIPSVIGPIHIWHAHTADNSPHPLNDGVKFDEKIS